MEHVMKSVETHADLLEILGIASTVLLIVGIVILPKLVARMPADYFKRDPAETTVKAPKRSLGRVILGVARNLFGLVLVVVGIAMLALPGNGTVTILLGVLLIDFPGKFKVVRYIAKRPGVMEALNWIREKGHAPPLES